MNTLIVALTFLAMHNCEHFARVIGEYHEGAEAGDLESQQVISLYYDMCKAGLKDEVGPMDSFECIYPNGTVIGGYQANIVCEFNIGEEG